MLLLGLPLHKQIPQKSTDLIIISAFFLDFIISSALSLSLFSICIMRFSVELASLITSKIKYIYSQHSTRQIIGKTSKHHNLEVYPPFSNVWRLAYTCRGKRKPHVNSKCLLYPEEAEIYIYTIYYGKVQSKYLLKYASLKLAALLCPCQYQ